jgi:hypothetical protein
MSEPSEEIRVDDLVWEQQGTELARERRDRFFREGGPRLRDIQVSASANRRAPASLAGSQLVQRRPTALQAKYETLCRKEPHFGPQDEYGMLVSPASLLLETELDELLMKPALDVAPHLAAVFKDNKKEREKSEMVDAWATGRFHATLGVASVVLMALRRGREQKVAAIGEFLERHFRPEYVALLDVNQLAPCLDAIRVKYRNPACHGKDQSGKPVAFTAADYAAFSRLAVANRNFADWDRHGPTPVPPPGDAGFLHHLLAGSRLLPDVALPPAAAAVNRLTELTAPRESPLSIHLEPRHLDEERPTRDVEVTPTPRPRPFRLGEQIRFAFQANRDCDVTLIDVGATGQVAVTLPNAWCSQARVAGGRLHFFPGGEFADFDLTLTGKPGRERVFAIATLAPLPAPLQPEGGAAFRQLQPPEVDALVDGITRLDARDWAACVCEFEIGR